MRAASRSEAADVGIASVNPATAKTIKTYAEMTPDQAKAAIAQCHQTWLTWRTTAFGVLTDVKPGMPAYEEELFGPVAAILRAKDEADAVRIANDSVFGLGAAVFTKDTARGERVARSTPVPRSSTAWWRRTRGCRLAGSRSPVTVESSACLVSESS